MTLPALINKAEKMILAQQFKKAYANLQNAINLISEEYGGPYECYWQLKDESRGYNLSQCQLFFDAFRRKLNIIQKCEMNDYDCYPKYKTKAEVLAAGGEVLENNTCGFEFRATNYYILNDGALLILNDANSPNNHNVFFGIDVNGKKGPNKWGYDLFYITLIRENIKKDVILGNANCGMKEKDGFYVNEILLK